MIKGISLTIGYQGGWKASLDKLELGTIRPRLNSKDSYGIRFDLVIGKLLRPIPKIYRWEFWCFWSHRIRNKVNPWNSGNHWFIFYLPWVILPFFSICFPLFKWNPGGYLGARTANFSRWIHWAKVKMWVAPGKDVWELDENGNHIKAWGWEYNMNEEYIHPSFTIRKEFLNK